jgi:hypothetical protein
VTRKRIVFVVLGLVAIVYIGVQWNAGDVAECHDVAIGAVADYRKQHGIWPATQLDLRPYCDSYCLREIQPKIESTDPKGAVLIGEDSSWLFGKVRTRTILKMDGHGNVVTAHAETPRQGSAEHSSR